jgi:hypothetical protein
MWIVIALLTLIALMGFAALQNRSKHYCNRCGAPYAWNNGKRVCPDCGKKFVSGMPAILALIAIIVIICLLMPWLGHVDNPAEQKINDPPKEIRAETDRERQARARLQEANGLQEPDRTRQLEQLYRDYGDTPAGQQAKAFLQK